MNQELSLLLSTVEREKKLIKKDALQEPSKKTKKTVFRPRKKLSPQELSEEARKKMDLLDAQADPTTRQDQALLSEALGDSGSRHLEDPLTPPTLSQIGGNEKSATLNLPTPSVSKPAKKKEPPKKTSKVLSAGDRDRVQQAAYAKLEVFVQGVRANLQMFGGLMWFRRTLSLIGLPQWNTWHKGIQEAVTVGYAKRIEDEDFVRGILMHLDMCEQSCSVRKAGRVVASMAGWHALAESCKNVAHGLWPEEIGMPG